MTNKNNKGERGSPWCNPLARKILSPRIPFIRTLGLDVEIRMDAQCKDRWSKRGGVNWVFFKI
jgi:hypothetical protein